MLSLFISLSLSSSLFLPFVLSLFFSSLYHYLFIMLRTLRRRRTLGGGPRRRSCCSTPWWPRPASRRTFRTWWPTLPPCPRAPAPTALPRSPAADPICPPRVRARNLCMRARRRHPFRPVGGVRPLRAAAAPQVSQLPCRQRLPLQPPRAPPPMPLAGSPEQRWRVNCRGLRLQTRDRCRACPAACRRKGAAVLRRWQRRRGARTAPGTAA